MNVRISQHAVIFFCVRSIRELFITLNCRPVIKQLKDVLPPDAKTGSGIHSNGLKNFLRMRRPHGGNNRGKRRDGPGDGKINL